MPGEAHRANDLRIGQGLGVRVLTVVGMLFLVFPVVVLAVYSFNASRFVTQWRGFSLKWYWTLLLDRPLWKSVQCSLVVAMSSTAISTVLGTMLALALGKYEFPGKRALQGMLYVPIILPDIIFGIALLSLYVSFHLPMGIASIVVAHVTFQVPSVALIVFSTVINFNPSIEEASLDLGADRWQTFWRVVLPGIASGVMAGALYAFTMSIDDFVVTFYTAGVGSSTLPLKIYSLLKTGISPEVNALAVILIVFTGLVIVVVYTLQRSKRLSRGAQYAIGGFFALILFGVGALSLVGQGERVLNVYTYSEYYDEGVVKDFEKTYGIEVVMDYMTTNEELLSKLQAGAAGYDVIFPSGYAVSIMISKGLLAELDFKNIPNASFIDPRFRYPRFDPEGKYCLPYAYGPSGIAYDADRVKEAVDSWRIFWNPKYKGRMLLLDDMWEVLHVGFKMTGHSIADRNPKDMADALRVLSAQKPLLKKYEANLSMAMLVSGEVDVVHVYSGEVARMLRERPELNLKFVVPKEGSLMFVDTFAIPRTAPHKENAEKFINFFLKPENSARNMVQILYPMPNPEAINLLPVEYRNSSVLFPPEDVVRRYEALTDPGPFGDLADKAWATLKNE